MKHENTDGIRDSGPDERNTASHGKAERNRKSGGASGGASDSYPKSDVRHWKARLFKNGSTRNGTRTLSSEWSVRISHGKRREQFNLRTANMETAAAKAQRIYKVVVGAGWTAALEEFKPDAKPADVVLDASRTTVGELIEASARLSPARWESMETYSQALRRIAAAVNEWDETNKFSPAGSKAWRAKVDSVTLASITPAAVEEWRKATLKAAETPAERNAAIVTTNSLIRNSRALVSRKIKDKVAELIQLPEKLWFHGISLETPPPLRYKSKIDAIEILQAGIAELATTEPEVLKCLFLTLVCGLRRSEADTLLWEQIDFKKGTIELMDTVHKRLKSEASAGEIAMDPQVVVMFKKWHDAKRGPFVLESALKPRGKEKQQQFRRYRANPTHLRLLEWLRSKGVPSHHPIHLMRKEVGSVIATRDGIFAASRFLRHSDIAITAKLYADLKEPVSSGFGAMLEPAKGNVVQGNFKADDALVAKAPRKPRKTKA